MNRAPYRYEFDFDLEVDLGEFGREAERIEETAAVEHHRAEHHLVVRALCAPDAARHPGIEKHRDSFLYQRGAARRGEVR